MTAISAGYQETCAIADGKAYCWGSDTNTLGDGVTPNSSVPIAVSTSGVLGGKTVTNIATGQWHVCAVADGKAYCWGSNSGSGALGNGSWADNATVPVGVDSSGAFYATYAFDNQVFF